MSLARRKSDMFETFKLDHSGDGYRWREYWQDYWMKQVHMYSRKGWWVIPCGSDNKRPAAGFPWTEKHLGREETIFAAAGGANLAVVMGRSGVAVLDYDGLDAPDLAMTGRTLTLITPKGCQLWTKAPADLREVDPYREPLRKRGFDSVRTGNSYALVPLSQTCANPGHEKRDCGEEHDWRIREWLDQEQRMLPFREVAEALV
jgi:Bifunctional DNA primase/polymerase, N-terminal